MCRRTFLAFITSLFLSKDKGVEINTDSTHGNGKYINHYFEDHQYSSLLCIRYQNGIEVYCGPPLETKYSNYKIDIQELLSKRGVLPYYNENPKFYRYPPHYFMLGNNRFDHIYDLYLT